MDPKKHIGEPVWAKKKGCPKDEKKRITKIIKAKNKVSNKHGKKAGSHSGDINKNLTNQLSEPPKVKHEKSVNSAEPADYSSDESTTDKLPKNLKDIQPAGLQFGFIGLGVMGKSMVKNLIKSGHDITVFSRSPPETDILEMGAKEAHSPAELIMKCDVTFCCVSDTDAMIDIIFGEQGVLKGLAEFTKLSKNFRGFVNLTITDPNTSMGIGQEIRKSQGYYLEAPIFGSSHDALHGVLTVHSAGDRVLFEKCISCFQAIASKAFYLNCAYGEGNKMSLLLNVMSGSVCAALAEAMCAIERLKMQKRDFLKIIKHTNGPFVHGMAKRMVFRSFKNGTSVKHMQKNLDMTLGIANSLAQPVPTIAAVNEVFKEARQKNLSEEDVSAVYKLHKIV